MSDMPGRIMAVDWGAARIGLAVSDPTQTLATPLATLQEKDKGAQIRRVAQLVAELEATHVLVGLPRHLDGADSESTRSATKFAEKLARFVSVPVELVDERLTSVVAEERLVEAGHRVSDRRSKTRIDSAAAAVLLQDWLDARTRVKQTGP